MHWVRLITFLIAPLVLALAAPVLVLWAWSNDLPLLPALLVGLVFTSLALAIHLVGQALPRHDDDLHLLWEEVEHLREAVFHDHQQENHQRETPAAAHEPAGHVADATADGEATQRQHSEPARHRDENMHDAALHRPLHHQHHHHRHHHEPAPAATTGAASAHHARELRLYMEPVVSLESNATVFYRALPALPADGGRIYLGDQAFLRARQQGWERRFTREVLERGAAFARQLKARGLTAAVAVPLDAAVLEDGGVVAQALLQTLEDDAREVSLMFILRREDLGRASQSARMHLLMLAQASDGVVLDMSVPDVNGFFLPAPLPVRYLDVPAARLAEVDHQPFMQRLGARGWTLVASGIDSPELLARARALASLGRGRHLSPPRRVREVHESPAANTGEAQRHAHVQQAAAG